MTATLQHLEGAPVAQEPTAITLPEARTESAPDQKANLAAAIQVGNVASSSVVAVVGHPEEWLKHKVVTDAGLEVRPGDNLDEKVVEAAWAAVAASRKPQGHDTTTKPDKI